MKILVVSYDVKVSSLAASYRARKFCKHLLINEFEVVVLTAMADQSIKGSDLDGCTVIEVTDTSRHTRFGFFWTRIFGFPDPSVYWLKHIKKLVEEKPSIFADIDIIFVTSPPHGIQNVGLFLNNLLGKPLISDFRDDFLTNHRIKWLTPLHKFSAAELEKAVVASSKYLIANTTIVRERFVHRHSCYSDKIITIPNGFDFDVKDNLIFNENELFNDITYVGGDYGGFAVDAMECIAKQIVFHNKQSEWRVVTAGAGDWSISKKYPFWKHHGLVDGKKADLLIKSSLCLILLMPLGEQEPSGTVPLKTYQYLASERPILYIGEQGSTTDLLSEFSGTFIFKRTKISSIFEWLNLNKEVLKTHHSRVKEFPYDFSLLTNSLIKLIKD